MHFESWGPWSVDLLGVIWKTVLYRNSLLSHFFGSEADVHYNELLTFCSIFAFLSTSYNLLSGVQHYSIVKGPDAWHPVAIIFLFSIRDRFVIWLPSQFLRSPLNCYQINMMPEALLFSACHMTLDLNGMLLLHRMWSQLK